MTCEIQTTTKECRHGRKAMKKAGTKVEILIRQKFVDSIGSQTGRTTEPKERKTDFVVAESSSTSRDEIQRRPRANRPESCNHRFRRRKSVLTARICI